MKKNVGKLDRILRLAVSAVVVILYIKGRITGTVGMTELVLAGVFTITALIGFCPIYAVIGTNTCPTKE